MIYLAKYLLTNILALVCLSIARPTRENAVSDPPCTEILDIGFLVDSSQSIRNDYDKEKLFVERIVSKFNISEAGTHAGVIVFSAKDFVNVAIKFNDHLSSTSFKKALDNLPYHGYTTRLDLALRLAHTDLFTLKSGARPNVRKVLFLITDGRQYPRVDKKGTNLDPAVEAAPLHLDGVEIFAVGVGKKVHLAELEAITRSKDRVYTVNNFEELLSEKVIKIESQKICGKAGEIKKEKPKPKKVEQKKSNCTQQCSPSGNCCGCCTQNGPVYVNIFLGSNGWESRNCDIKFWANNVVQSNENCTSQQHSSTSSKKQLNFGSEDSQTKEILKLVKELLPHYSKDGDVVKKILKALETKSFKKKQDSERIERQRLSFLVPIGKV